MTTFEQDVEARVMLKTASLLGGDGSLSPLMYGAGGALLGGMAGSRLGSLGASALAALGGLGGLGIANAVNANQPQNSQFNQNQAQLSESEILQQILQGGQ